MCVCAEECAAREDAAAVMRSRTRSVSAGECCLSCVLPAPSSISPSLLLSQPQAHSPAKQRLLVLFLCVASMLFCFCMFSEGCSGESCADAWSMKTGHAFKFFHAVLSFMTLLDELCLLHTMQCSYSTCVYPTVAMCCSLVRATCSTGPLCHLH